MLRKWIIMTMLNLLIAMSIGALLRFAFVEEVSWLAFKNFLHAHSHVAMLGWVYLALYTFLVASFLSKKQNLRKYNILFWLTQVSVLGMLITFPIMGYAGWSIGFSVLHTLLSYVFVYLFLRDLKKANVDNVQNSLEHNSFSKPFIKSGLFFLIFSSLGLWAMGPIMAMDYQGSALYYSTIQFYLHFQFNGWFIFTIIGLLFKIVEDNNIQFSKLIAKRFLWLLSLSCYLTYALAVTWSKPIPVLFFINSVGVILQLGALFFFIKLILEIWKPLRKRLLTITKSLFTISLASFVLKILIQSAVIIPVLAVVAYTIRNYVMGFLHLMLIGLVTLFLFAYGQSVRLIRFDSYFAKAGIILFIIGFILSELILFVQGTMFWATMGFMPYYYEVLFGASTFIPIGLALILLAQFRGKEINV